MLLITILASPGTCYSVYADRYTSYSHVYKQATEMDASYKHGNNNHHIIMYTCVYIVLCNLCISPVLSLFTIPSKNTHWRSTMFNTFDNLLY